MTHPDQTPEAGPYLSAAAALVNAGWWPLPLPERAKKNPPNGFTGRAGVDPDRDRVAQWMLDQPGGNIAVRMPSNVVGIDVDNYDDKPGAQTLADLSGECGGLPQTVKITSRDDDFSGIYLFRLPEGVDPESFRGGLPGIDVIRHHHRYAVVPPSIHPDTGKVYRAIDEATGVIHTSLPSPDELPELPNEWVRALTSEISVVSTNTQPELIQPVSLPTGEMCRAMSAQLDRALSALSGGLARHDVATGEALALVRMGEQGHRGGQAALDTFGFDFVQRVTGDRPGGRREAEYEWSSIVRTAMQRVAAKPTPETDKGCCGSTQQEQMDQLAGLVPAGTIDLRISQDIPLPTPSQSPNPEPVGQPQSSWLPIDLDSVFDGTYQPVEPDILARADGACLFYSGLVHSIFGESESGKSWVALVALADQIAQGHDCAMIDFESDARSIGGRLMALGVDPQQAKAHFSYIRPERGPTVDDPAWQSVLMTQRALVVIDGITEAVGLFGAKTDDNDAITQFMNVFPVKMASLSDAAVVTIDHVKKDKETRNRFPIGGQAKLATITGCAYLVEPMDLLAPGHVGHLALRIAKDRPAGVRRNAGEWRQSDRTQLMAMVQLDSDDDGRIAWSILNPEEAEALAVQKRAEYDAWRPTFLMEAVSRYLEANGDSSQTAIEEGCKGTTVHLRKATEKLVEEGFVARFIGARNSKIHHLNSIFREADDLINSPRRDPVEPRRDTRVPSVTPNPSADGLASQDATQTDGVGVGAQGRTPQDQKDSTPSQSANQQNSNGYDHFYPHPRGDES